MASFRWGVGEALKPGRASSANRRRPRRPAAWGEPLRGAAGPGRGLRAIQARSGAAVPARRPQQRRSLGAHQLAGTSQRHAEGRRPPQPATPSAPAQVDPRRRAAAGAIRGRRQRAAGVRPGRGGLQEGGCRVPGAGAGGRDQVRRPGHRRCQGAARLLPASVAALPAAAAVLAGRRRRSRMRRRRRRQLQRLGEDCSRRSTVDCASSAPPQDYYEKGTAYVQDVIKQLTKKDEL